MRNHTACFTGHRKIPFMQTHTIKKNLKKVIVNLIEQGYCFFGASGALGFDYEKRKVMQSEVLDAAQENSRERNHFA